jgi:phosphohistidine phosphatase SixA
VATSEFSTMMNIRNAYQCALLLAASAVLWACAQPDRNFAPPAASEPRPELAAPADIAAALAKGGYLIYLRHGETNRDESEREAKNRETGRFSIEDCATQRNLSDQGREQARQAGAAYRRARIPVSQHLSSRYCRALQTANLYADKVELSEALTSEGAITKSPERIAAVRALLSTRPPPGQNIALFAHQGIFYAATELTVQEGWAVVLEPGNFKRIVARIAPDQWEAIGRAR